eukprot:TRINITY_DN14654_c0_g1_i1.p1 TRINITY_DN14654_c0_g1~~TRINITY_DN14654_c0_g1_i1.p1  ORF type:complete len:659 (-),score=124.35 TRINITY_DN14654_c0_g1_i1:1384-3327(-)
MATLPSVDTRLASLRGLMDANGVHAYVVPSGDAHQSEYISDHDSRRAFISGFTGSAGTVVVTKSHALLWTDGRYFLQAAQELDLEDDEAKGTVEEDKKKEGTGNVKWTLMKAGLPNTPTIEAWLAKSLGDGERVGFDPKLITVAQLRRYEAALPPNTLKSVNNNLIDEVWGEHQPPTPCNPVVLQDVKYSGRSVTKKLEWLREQLTTHKTRGITVTMLDEIAWLFNIRGSDIEFNPVCIAYAYVTASKAYFFVNSAKLEESVLQALVKDGITIKPYDDVFVVLSEEAKSNSEEKIWLDTDKCSEAIRLAAVEDGSDVAAGAKRRDWKGLVREAPNPIILEKAIKNEVELEGMRRCHLRDAAALVSFLAWLEQELVENANKALDECSVADRLQEFREELTDFVSLSFDTISGSGPNGAIIHYHPMPDTCAKLSTELMYLCDSGGQYRDGTTDVTRTVHFGKPTAHEIRCFTRVLQGHIALDAAVFPEGTNGYQLDLLARQYLWKDGLDYQHGTGHGVGAFLNVHEGPHGISFRPTSRDVALEPGMVVTNEPGYYESGAFGIRIENEMIVKEIETPHHFPKDKRYFGFEPITLVPLQRELFDYSLLSPSDVKWINDYHQRCWVEVTPLLEHNPLAQEWMRKNTEPVGIY